MTAIPVSVAAASAEGRLYPAYLNSSGILTLDSPMRRPCPFGISVDGTIVLDFDEGGVLAGVELIMPMRRWKGRGDTSDPGGDAGSIVLPEPRARSAHHPWPVTVSYDVQNDRGRIAFGSAGHDRTVRLSDACSALLLDGGLTGFWFSLAR